MEYILNNNPQLLVRATWMNYCYSILVNEEETDVLDDEENARAVAATLVAGVEQAP
jgi:hypothetical protein